MAEAIVAFYGARRFRDHPVISSLSLIGLRPSLFPCGSRTETYESERDQGVISAEECNAADVYLGVWAASLSGERQRP